MPLNYIIRDDLGEIKACVCGVEARLEYNWAYFEALYSIGVKVI